MHSLSDLFYSACVGSLPSKIHACCLYGRVIIAGLCLVHNSNRPELISAYFRQLLATAHIPFFAASIARRRCMKAHSPAKTADARRTIVGRLGAWRTVLLVPT